LLIDLKGFFHVFSILGMNLFGCKFTNPITGKKDRKNFDSLLWATVTVFQVKYWKSPLKTYFVEVHYITLVGKIVYQTHA
jgi:hypothetical protein